jgi:hypothetical protein
VGFWKVDLISEGNTGFGLPDGAIFDSALAQVHDDGTEVSDGSRDPVTGSICFGSWKKISRLHYHLNHFGKSWVGGVYVGLARIQEEWLLSEDGNSFTGTFTVDQYDTVGNLLAHFTGKVAARRINIDTTVKDLL